jgi:hypothetical protein
LLGGDRLGLGDVVLFVRGDRPSGSSINDACDEHDAQLTQD